MCAGKRLLEDGEHSLEGDGAVIHQHDVGDHIGFVGGGECRRDVRVQYMGDVPERARGGRPVSRLPVRDGGSGYVQPVCQLLLGKATLFPQATERFSKVVVHIPSRKTIHTIEAPRLLSVL